MFTLQGCYQAVKDYIAKYQPAAIGIGVALLVIEVSELSAGTSVNRTLYWAMQNGMFRFRNGFGLKWFFYAAECRNWILVIRFVENQF